MQDVPGHLVPSIDIIRREFPFLTIHFTPLHGEFSPEALLQLEEEYMIPRNFMFVGCPSGRSRWTYDQMPGMRIVTANRSHKQKKHGSLEHKGSSDYDYDYEYDRDNDRNNDDKDRNTYDNNNTNDNDNDNDNNNDNDNDNDNDKSGYMGKSDRKDRGNMSDSVDRKVGLGDVESGSSESDNEGDRKEAQVNLQHRPKPKHHSQDGSNAV
jgi:hypothetical protein